jgi:two-component system sensor histidine kinase/response regulator
VAEAKDLVASAIARAQTDLEEALSELEKLPDFDAGAVTFAAHALNNYLTVTGGTVELIMFHLADHPDPQLRIWLEGLQHATDLMTRTVSQLLSASTTTEAKLRFEMVDLPVMVQRACDYYQRVADRKTIRFIVDSTVDDPLVWTDRVRVAAVLDNLLSNAVKYSQPSKNIWVNVRSEKGGTVCSVRDEGPGLSQEDHSKLFQRGVRLAPQPTGDEYSRGYGLAVAKELVEKLGGQIWCDSELGHGSCFSFRLPLAPERLPGSGPDLAP